MNRFPGFADATIWFSAAPPQTMMYNLTHEKGLGLVDEFLEPGVQLCGAMSSSDKWFAVLCLFLFYEQK